MKTLVRISTERKDFFHKISLFLFSFFLIAGVLAQPTTTTVTSANNPQCSGASVTFTATISPAAPGGTVQFYDGATPIGGPSAVTAGVATYTTSALGPGSHSITAQFGGFLTFLPSTSPVFNQVIDGGTKTWIGSGSGGGGPDGNFNNPANWSPAGVPTACHDVIIGVDIVSIFNLFGANLVVALSANATIKSLQINVGGFQFLNSPGAAFTLNVGSRTLTILGNTTMNTFTQNFLADGARTRISVGSAGIVTYGGNLTTLTSNGGTNYPFYAINNNLGKMYFNGTTASLAGIGNDPNNKPAQVIFNGTGTQTLTHSSGAQSIYFAATSTDIGETNSPTVVLAGAGAGGFRTAGNLNINTISILDIGATQTFNRNGAGSSINMNAGSLMRVRGNAGGIGTSNFPAFFSAYAFNATSTVDYNGTGAQAVTQLPLYGHLSLAGTGAKTAAGNINAQNNITIQGSAVFTAGANVITLGGNWTNYGNGGFAEQTSMVDFNGTGAQTINTTGGEIFYGLRKTASGTTTQLSDVALQALSGASPSFTLSAGTYDAGVFTFSGTAPVTFNMSAGLLKLAKLTAPALPEFAINPYTISGGTIELYGAGNQILQGSRAYRNLTFSTSGIKTVTSAPTSITGTILTQNTVILDVAANTMGGAGTDLTMTGTSVYKTAGTTSVKPDAQGTYTLGVGTTVEFTNSLLSTEDIRVTAPTYYNVVISGSNVANPNLVAGIKFQAGGTFTVKKYGIFKLGNSAGFSGGLNTSIANTNNPNIVLEDSSVVQYYGGPAGTNPQVITTVIPYSGLTLSGTSIKTAPAGTVTVKGDLKSLSSGFAHSNGTFLLNGTTFLQNYNSTGTPITFYNFTAINSAFGVRINSALNIYKQLSLGTNGRLNMAAGNVTLKSDATNTANVDKILTNDAITYGSGRFIVERYIATGTGAGQHTKSWQFLGVPVHHFGITAQTVKAAWQEGAATPNANPVAGYGTQITSNNGGSTAGATALGFDVYTAPGPTMKTYVSASNTWLGIANTNSLPIANSKGYMVFVRGDRSVTGYLDPATPTILRTTGKLFAPSAIAANRPPVTTVTSTKFESISNPYASAVDFTLLTKSITVDDKFYVWDPLLTANVNGLGGYQTISAVAGWLPTPGGTANYPSATPIKIIQSGQAFLVYSTLGGGTVTFNEAAKVNTSALVTRPSENTNAGSDRQFFRASLHNGNSNEAPLADGNMMVFDTDLSNELDANDAVKMSNTNENFGIVKANNTLALEARAIINRQDTIFYSLSNLRTQPYQLRFNPENMLPGMTAFLVDKFLNNTTDVSLVAPTTVDINITSDPASSAADRFYVVFRPAIVVPVLITKISATRNSNASISVNWNVENETNLEQYEVEKSADGRNFIKINATSPSLNNGGRAMYLHIDEDPYENDNFYRVKALGRTGQSQYSAIVKVAALAGNPGISVYPNPVAGKIMNIQFINQAAGEYNLQLSNKVGQVVYRNMLSVSGTNTTSSVKVGELTKGSYQLTVIARDGEKTILQVILE